MGKLWVRRQTSYEDNRVNHMPGDIREGEPADCYESSEDEPCAVEELVDTGGGYLHDDKGSAFKFVAPLPR